MPDDARSESIEKLASRYRGPTAEQVAAIKRDLMAEIEKFSRTLDRAIPAGGVPSRRPFAQRVRTRFSRLVTRLRGGAR